MDSQTLAQLSQPSAEVQMQVLEIVLQIVTLSILVLLGTTLVIIIWLCLLESRLPRRGSPRAKKVEDEKTGNPVFTDLHADNSEIHSNAIALSDSYATWARRMILRFR